jgi:hypothetical protein
MIVFDLRCGAGHGFEGWFADGDAFAVQRDGGQIPCPYCGDAAVERALSVPRIGKSQAASPPDDAIRKLVALQADMLKHSTWVGSDFARQARSMAEGDVAQAIIHGQATIAEVRDLHDDGVGVMPLPFPVIPPESRN